MKRASIQKLDDYISGLKALHGALRFPIGAIVAGEKERTNIRKTLEKKGVAFVRMEEGEHPDIVVGALAEKIQQGGVLAFEFGGAVLPQKISAFLSELSQNRVDAMLPGGTRIFFRALPQSAKLILLFSPESFEETLLPDVVSSVCRI